MMIRAGMLTLAGAAAPSLALAACRRALVTERTQGDRGAAGQGRSLTASEWRAMSAWTETLMPSGPGSPGAREVNAVGYVDGVLADPDTVPGDVTLVREGITKLDAIALDLDKPSFFDLDEAGRERALVRLRQDPYGARAIWLVLSFTLEAMFGDPVYGGNPGGIGWNWIAYEPGIPRAKAPWRGKAR